MRSLLARSSRFSFHEKCDVMKEVLQQILEFIISKLTVNLIC